MERHFPFTSADLGRITFAVGSKTIEMRDDTFQNVLFCDAEKVALIKTSMHSAAEFISQWLSIVHAQTDPRYWFVSLSRLSVFFLSCFVLIFFFSLL